MTAQLESRVLDLGLNVLDTESTSIYLCSVEPTTFELATAGAGSLGHKTFGAGGVFNSPTVATDGNGRKVTSNPVTDGVIDRNGNATWWAVVGIDALHVHGQLSSSQQVYAGNAFTLSAFDITMRAHA